MSDTDLIRELDILRNGRLSHYPAVRRDEARANIEAHIVILEAEVARLRTALEAPMVVWEIAYDYESFGLYATKEEAEADLERQIANGGPAWDACEVVERHVKRRALRSQDGDTTG